MSSQPAGSRGLAIFVAVMLSQVACVGSADVDGDVTETQQAVTLTNALTRNALTRNALTRNALTRNALTRNALTRNALTRNALTMEALRDPAAREVFQYIVSCSMSAGEHIDLTVDDVTYGYDGEIGLAPEWGEEGGSCDQSCQELVSSCLLARIDYLGEHVEISIRGRGHALEASQSEQATYSHREATYYGNVFGETQLLYACLSPGQTSIPRVCGDESNGGSIEDCVADVLGSCDALCRPAMRDGAFETCEDQAPLAYGRYPRGTKTYRNAITVYLQP